MDNNITIVTPGQKLSRDNEYIASEGTYYYKGSIYSSVLGFRHFVKNNITSKEESDDIVDNSNINNNNNNSNKDYIVVLKEKDPGVVPEIGSVVTVQVLRINPRLASVAILCVGTKALKETFNGIIRVQDVRATEIDKVEIYKSFRPGDIVIAEVISLGDSRSYFLSTAKNELGVVFAQSVAGATMIPISWNMMQCPKTKTKEYRKVAKMTTNDNENDSENSATTTNTDNNTESQENDE
ncbi:3'-5' exoribonuclease [Heterostelium album PN500]|uniref:3'-5' exoribonuclease n=1 Tax=Heterostelium pallidum (strain ATCC 26659 / Pp 5 / PN500) TaxID=670386 RepID=D3B1K7_HETP5|nr:3'-5' exoribonuclease [Heterostelium album PN500]EFA85181.1 3'-5' exoribonuclease [Heterostelium album PN500]|eukprot:XP_020437290.1 3'-5' exoribonuclease [Heterostelium album PN500]